MNYRQTRTNIDGASKTENASYLAEIMPAALPGGSATAPENGSEDRIFEFLLPRCRYQSNNIDLVCSAIGGGSRSFSFSFTQVFIIHLTSNYRFRPL